MTAFDDFEIDEKERRQIIAEVIKITEPPELKPDEFTVGQYAKQAGITQRRARDHLGKLVEQGQLTCREVIHKQRKRNAYAWVEGKEDAEATT